MLPVYPIMGLLCDEVVALAGQPDPMRKLHGSYRCSDAICWISLGVPMLK